MSTGTYTVGDVARRARVTIRTLHHYDEIGLLVPSERRPNGYRLYSDSDLERLHEILLLRELGFSLGAILKLVDDPPGERRYALRLHRERLQADLKKRESVLKAIDRAIALLDGEHTVTSEDLFDGFGDFDHAQYEEEARERWGHTEAYRESARRAKKYGKADWAAIRREAEANTNRMVELMRNGRAPDSVEAMECAEAHRAHIERWFYPLDHEMHRGLADLYMSDARFTAFYEECASGLTSYLSTAIRANADKHQSGKGT